MKKIMIALVLALFCAVVITNAQDTTTVDKKVNESPSRGNYPPPPPPPPPSSDEIFEFVEEFPLFPGCAELSGTLDAKKECSDNEMRKFLMQKVGYPKEAREMGIEGKVFVSFVIMPNGTVSKIEIVRDMTGGGGLAEAALKAVELMNGMEKRWTPGMQRGKAVPVRIMMPFVFKLNNDPVLEPERKKKRGRK
jgi:protein TonB